MTRSTLSQRSSAPRVRRSLGLVLAVLALGIALPGIAEACAVCFQAKTDASRIAFIATTAFMTALPLVLFGSVVYWLRRRFAAAEPETG